MSSEIRREFYAVSVDTNTVILAPLAGLDDLPVQEKILSVTIATSTTLPTPFWVATGGCDRYEVIIRRKK